MTIDEELSIIRDNIAEYGQTNITQEEYNMIYNKAIDDLLGGMNQITYNYQNADELFEKICDLAEQLKVGGENE